MIKLDERDYLPQEIADTDVRHVRNLFPNPTLVHLPGENAPLFVSVILHGNEDAGWLAIQEFFRRYANNKLPRGLVIFFGNVDACASNVRYLKGQVDFNRAWPGSDLPDTPVHDLLAKVTERVLACGISASIDIHNNTGRNPHYGCICSEDSQHINFASLFSERIVYFTLPKGVQTQAFMEHCPAVTCECGKIGDLSGAVEAADFLGKCMLPNALEATTAAPSAMQVYSMVARIQVRDHCSVGFVPGSDLVLRKDLDLLNFQELSAGEPIGKLTRQIEDCFVVNDQAGRDVTADYLTISDRQLRFGRSVLPSMLTQDLEVIRQDCLGYIMERRQL